MNAYELADALKNDWADKFRFDAANMLRQQADRIAELEKKLQESAMDYISICSQADEHYARVQELEKQGEPVAWMEYIQDEEWEVWYTKPTNLPEGHSYKPLYLTPQIKPLSDEEIIKIFNQIWNAGGNTNGVMHRFARAIEERHGIK